MLVEPADETESFRLFFITPLPILLIVTLVGAGYSPSSAPLNLGAT